ncbi:hypothetical protein MCUN1_002039 [Malassezia cuniculi]|uniref:RNA-binding S4 domain-containing protein n=1 Tax=Malassezia cuniculi TaxID=948313 RepID=A0AAF0J716_9BASI|nr:hypothetical protein MCUN1_002039 [Malassezia cuniculi]
MRKANVFRPEAAIPRMQTTFTKTSLTMYQQRWRSKRLLRGYHGDWIPERRFKRWFLPTHLPNFAPEIIRPSTLENSRQGRTVQRAADTPVPPITTLMMRDVERRLDVVVFRCCFAHSAYHARMLVLHGKVSVNGQPLKNPGHLLEVGDLITVDAESIPMLNPHIAKRLAKSDNKAEDAAAEEAEETSTETASAEPSEQAGEAENATSAADAAPSEGEAAKSSANEGNRKEPKEVALPPGVYPFNLPHYAAPFLFVPPYLEVSFRTCSAIYLRHPTLTTHLVRNRDASQKMTGPMRVYSADIPSPYPVGGEMFGLAWEHYARNAPRVRSDERRTKLQGRYGRESGFVTTRAWEQDRRRVAIRRGWGRKRDIPNHAPKL